MKEECKKSPSSSSSSVNSSRQVSPQVQDKNKAQKSKIFEYFLLIYIIVIIVVIIFILVTAPNRLIPRHECPNGTVKFNFECINETELEEEMQKCSLNNETNWNIIDIMKCADLIKSTKITPYIFNEDRIITDYLIFILSLSIVAFFIAKNIIQ